MSAANSGRPGSQQDLDRALKALARLAEDGYDEVEVEFGTARVRVARRPPAPVASAAVASSAPSRSAEIPRPAAEPDDGLHRIASPMIGTFYRKPRPDAAPFVEVGDQVRKGQVLCIIEAMKLMNNIEADAAGEIVSIEPEDGSPVQFGDPLVAIRPA